MLFLSDIQRQLILPRLCFIDMKKIGLTAEIKYCQTYPAAGRAFWWPSAAKRKE